ncbi:MAG: hypothetical protein WCD30_18330, partial [Pseudolabrys sp.]
VLGSVLPMSALGQKQTFAVHKVMLGDGGSDQRTGGGTGACAREYRLAGGREDAAGSARVLYAAEAQRLLVGHVGESQEIAEGYLYLMRQTYVTGQTLAIDGGRLLKFPQANNA